MTVPKINYAEFYITNVCNFNCDGCNRFNNLNFSGRQHWQDYQDVYAAWSRVLDIERYTVLGGEPMTSPDYLDWLSGINMLWPQAQGVLLTNGHYLRPNNRELYQLLAGSHGRLSLEIGLHNVNRATAMLDTVSQWLQGDIQLERFPQDLNQIPGFAQHWQHSYDSIRDQSWPDCPTVDHWHQLPVSIQQECIIQHRWSPGLLGDRLRSWRLQDSNGVVVVIRHENQFSQSSLILEPGRAPRLHQSDPVKAHSVCGFVQSKCYHFVKGQLYKCGPVALFPELDKKFGLDLTDQERQLVHGYSPASIELDAEAIKAFVARIDDPIQQCQFCPESFDTREIFAEHGRKTIFLKTI